MTKTSLDQFQKKEYTNVLDEKKSYYVCTSDLMLALNQICWEAQQLKDKTATDTGTCVLGAGIKVWVIEKGRKYPTRLDFLNAPFQGNTGSYKALKPCLEYMQQNYPDLHASWHDGNMD